MAASQYSYATEAEMIGKFILKFHCLIKQLLFENLGNLKPDQFVAKKEIGETILSEIPYRTIWGRKSA